MILFLPWINMLAALIILLLPRSKEQLMRSIALSSCAISSLIVLVLYLQFDAGKTGYQFVYRFNWVPALGISYQEIGRAHV